MVASEQHLYQTILHFYNTIQLPRKLATGNIHDYLFYYFSLMGILSEVLKRIDSLRSMNYTLCPIVEYLQVQNWQTDNNK